MSLAQPKYRAASSPWTDAEGQIRVHTETVTPVLRRILVPLDGSPLAECALGHAAELAAAAVARLVLVRAAASSHHLHLGQPNHHQEDAESYLVQVRRGLQGTGLSIDIAAPAGQIPQAPLTEIADQKPDLIVMTSHGHSGPRYTVLGGVADAVIAAGQAPVLLQRQSAVENAPAFRSLVGQNVLVLLDGSALAEAALPVALELARVLKSELVLFKAIEVYSVPYAVPTELMTAPDVDVQLAWDASFDVKEAESYLGLVARRLNRQAPDTAVHTRVQVGHLIEQVVAFDSAASIGLIVTATHARSGLAEALRGGTTAHGLLRATTCPLVLVHPTL